MASSNTIGMIAAALLGGIVGALIMTFAYFVGIALVGAGMGALAAHVFWTTWRAVDPPALAVILLSVAGAVGAMLLQRYVIIFSTAFSGAWTMIVGGLALDGRHDGRAGRGDRQRLDSLPVHAAAGPPVGAVCVGRAGIRRRGRADGDYGAGRSGARGSGSSLSLTQSRRHSLV